MQHLLNSFFHELFFLKHLFKSPRLGSCESGRILVPVPSVSLQASDRADDPAVRLHFGRIQLRSRDDRKER
jgi:hypothetical protein